MKTIHFNVILSVIFLLVALVLPAFTQVPSNLERRADEFYENYSYNKAAEIYERLYLEEVNKSKYVQRLANCYDKMLNYPKALSYFSLLVQLDQCTPEDYYKYAKLLRINGNVNESKDWLEKYLEKVPDDNRAKTQLENINLLLKLSTNLGHIKVKDLEGNTRFIDMCPIYFNSRLVYSSARDSFSFIRNKYEWNNQPFLDLYVSTPGPNSNLTDDVALPPIINTRFHEGPACFTSDYNTIYFTRNSFLDGKISRTKEGVNNLKIFISDFKGKEWKKIKSFPFNSDRYSVGHPALSADNKTIYFVSDMPGGFGETDIYKSNWVNEEWGKPVNLGESINTKGKEMFPYIDKDGILYFASNGQPSIGGLDIFAAKAEENGSYLVINLGSPINSPYDDFGYIINKDSFAGYFTSDRPGGKGEDDIYSFSVNGIELRVLCYDYYTKVLMPASKITLLGEEGRVIDSKVADQDGTVEFSVNPGAKYKLVAENNYYITETKKIQIKSSSFDFKQSEDIFLKNDATYLTISVIDKGSGLIIPNRVLNVSEGNSVERKLEDSSGIVRIMLKDSTDYVFTATAENYLDEAMKFTSVGKSHEDYSITIKMDRLSVGKKFVLDDLYYDLDKYNIRPDAESVVNMLLKILLDNPEIRISIDSHTDSRASIEYNQILSQKRSESVVAYLIRKGINPSRLVAKGYGESQLINKCTDGIECTEEEHQENRRTVIEILNKNIKKIKRGSKDVYYF